MPFSLFFGSQLEGVRIAASKMSPMMETINMVNVNIIVKCQFYVCGLYLSLRKHPFLLTLRRSRNVPSGEERGETDVFAGYLKLVLIIICSVLVCSICWQYSPARTRSQTFRSVANRHRTRNKGNFISSGFFDSELLRWEIKNMSNAILMFFRQGVPVLLFPWLCSVLKIWRPLLVRLLLRAVSVPY